MTTHSDASILSTNLAGLPLRNPVLLAAGTCGTLDEMADVLDLSRVGGIVTKSITPEPRDGNQTWRIVPLEVGMLNAIGLANVGIDAFVRDYAPRVGDVPAPVIGSIAGFSVDDYVRVAAAMDAIPTMPAVELNVSCPNVHAGCEFGSDPALLAELVKAVRPVLKSTRLFIKLSPIAFSNPSLVQIAKAAIEPMGSAPGGPNLRPGADALCVSNTMPAMAIDVETRLPRIARVTGGLSGPAVHPVAVRLVHEVYRGVAQQTKTPIIGIGGVNRWEHAAEFILAGATAVEVGTGLFADPRAPISIANGLEKWVRRQGRGHISELIGAVTLPG